MNRLRIQRLQLLVTVALCVIMAMTFNSCSDDDVNPVTNELTSTMVGTWEQDGDDDIFVINADGTGVGYEDPLSYANLEDDYKLKWEYKNESVYITYFWNGGVQKDRLCVKTLSKDEIVWQRFYDDDLDGIYEYSDIWIWKRFVK